MIQVALIEPSPRYNAVGTIDGKERASYAAGDKSGGPIIRLHGQNYHEAR